MQRIAYIDIAKTIGIYLVILGHYVYYLDQPSEDNPMWKVMQCISLFHMPLFFIISGMLFKSKGVKATWDKLKERLIKPYIYLCAIVFVIGLCLSLLHGDEGLKTIIKRFIGIFCGGDFIISTPLGYCGPMWFCYALVMIQMTVAYVCRKKNYKALSLLIIVIGGGV